MRLISRAAFLRLPEGVLYCRQEGVASPDMRELCVKGETRPPYGPVVERCRERRVFKTDPTLYPRAEDDHFARAQRGESVPLDPAWDLEDAGTDLLDPDYLASGYWVLEPDDLDAVETLIHEARSVYRSLGSS